MEGRPRRQVVKMKRLGLSVSPMCNCKKLVHTFKREVKQNRMTMNDSVQ